MQDYEKHTSSTFPFQSLVRVSSFLEDLNLITGNYMLTLWKFIISVTSFQGCTHGNISPLLSESELCSSLVVS